MMRRRDFLRAAGSIVASANASSANVSPSGVAATSLAASDNKQASMRVEGHRIFVHTHTQSAVIEKGFLTSLISKKTGEEFIKDVAVEKGAALQLLYRGDETISID